jgi:carbonic anhydrase
MQPSSRFISEQQPVQSAIRSVMRTGSLRMLCFSATIGAASALPKWGLSDPSQQRWGYFESAGPHNWSDLSPEYAACGSGTEQSPVDLSEESGVFSVAEKDRLVFNYQPTPLEVEDTGHGLQVNMKTPSGLQRNRQTFRLVQFHVHTPSEHTWIGGRFPAEIHLVHRSLKGEIAVVSILVRVGPALDELDKVLQRLPVKKGAILTDPEVTINPLRFLPTKGGYVAYKGSLTTPPCTEGVQWFVLGAPISLSHNQIAHLVGRYSFNARPVQSLNARRITLVK